MHTSGRFEGALSGLVTAYKDQDRRDVASILGALLTIAVDAALVGEPAMRRAVGGQRGPMLLVPVPSSRASRRRRGDAPLEGLATLAARGFSAEEVVVAKALRVRRRVADQAGLGATGRHLNVEHSMALRPAWSAAVPGSACILVDDVLTTGATLVEAARALRSGGAEVVVAATICATQRRGRAPRTVGAGPR